MNRVLISLLTTIIILKVFSDDIESIKFRHNNECVLDVLDSFQREHLDGYKIIFKPVNVSVINELSQNDLFSLVIENENNENFISDILIESLKYPKITFNMDFNANDFDALDTLLFMCDLFGLECELSVNKKEIIIRSLASHSLGR